MARYAWLVTHAARNLKQGQAGPGAVSQSTGAPAVPGPPLPVPPPPPARRRACGVRSTPHSRGSHRRCRLHAPRERNESARGKVGQGGRSRTPKLCSEGSRRPHRLGMIDRYGREDARQGGTGGAVPSLLNPAPPWPCTLRCTLPSAIMRPPPPPQCRQRRTSCACCRSSRPHLADSTAAAS